MATTTKDSPRFNVRWNDDSSFTVSTKSPDGYMVYRTFIGIPPVQGIRELERMIRRSAITPAN
jgi:hypothetical protein